MAEEEATINLSDVLYKWCKVKDLANNARGFLIVCKPRIEDIDVYYVFFVRSDNVVEYKCYYLYPNRGYKVIPGTHPYEGHPCRMTRDSDTKIDIIRFDPADLSLLSTDRPLFSVSPLAMELRSINNILRVP